jgi:SnoaL-like domain
MASAESAFHALKEAIESRNANGMLEMYADDALMVEYDKRSPPSSPMTLHGKAAIEPLLRDICDREMTHEIDDEVIGDERFSFTETFEYPDGNRVFSAMVCDLSDGKIARQVGLQAWDQ